MILPRLLVIDPTPLEGPAATSALKATLLEGWRRDAVLSVYSSDAGLMVDGGDGAPRRVKVHEAAKRIVEVFQPQTILYRPVEDAPGLAAFADDILAQTDAKLALWFMDDWLERLRANDPDAYGNAEAQVKALLNRSSVNFSISEVMAKEMNARFGADFVIARNGVDPRDWVSRANLPGDVFTVRYAGSLAPDTTLESVTAVAERIGDMADRGEPVRLEIRTHAHWLRQYQGRFSRFSGVSIAESNLSPTDYRDWLRGGDALLVAYNFDPATKRYLRYSFANKLPEALASGTPVICLGPTEVETVRYLQDHKLGLVVDDAAAFEDAVKLLQTAPERTRGLSDAGRSHAFKNFDIGRMRSGFQAALAEGAPHAASSVEVASGVSASFDECAFVFHALDAGASSGVMIDVGAHEGAASRPFADAGWRVVAFEPDENNRAILARTMSGSPGVTIRPEAVGAAQAIAPFYRSSVSTGISGLNSFDPSHRKAGEVEVTTLDAALEEEGLSGRGIEFLKIDVEGRELDVLDGFDLAAAPPRAIVAEFDGRKGVGAGDIEARLERAGYHLYFSEWRPIEAYGADHQWRRLVRHASDVDPQAWGNVIALRDLPAETDFERAFDAAFSRNVIAASAESAAVAVAGLPPELTPYRKVSRLVWTVAPGLSRHLSRALAKVRSRTD